MASIWDEKSDKSHASGKRGRGRPIGSSPYEKRDNDVLARYADQAVRTPGLKLAPTLEKLGYKTEAEIRRVQAKWRRGRKRLLEEAQLRLDSEPPSSLLETLFSFLSALQHIGDGVRTSGAARLLEASMQRADRRRKARATLGLGSDLPFDPENPDDLEAALSRFEPRIRHQCPRFAQGSRRSDARRFTPSMRLYLLAVLLHEASLDQLQRESQQREGSRKGLSIRRPYLRQQKGVAVKTVRKAAARPAKLPRQPHDALGAERVLMRAPASLTPYPRNARTHSESRSLRSPRASVGSGSPTRC